MNTVANAGAARLRELIEFYETLAPESLARLEEFYAEDAYFRDPFNEVRGVHAIRAIFRRMFDTLDTPRFAVHEWTGDERGYFLVWDLSFRSRWLLGGPEQAIHGASHLRFNAHGEVVYHRDYWDTGEELYAKLPAIGGLIRWLRRRIG